MQTGLMSLLGLGTLFIGWVLTLVLPQIRYAAWGVLALGVILIAVAFALDYRRVGRALRTRRGKLGTSTSLMVSIFVGIILLVNAISIGNYARIDTTGLAQYTLTSQTKDVLANLDERVEVIEFFNPVSDPYQAAAYASSLLEEYANYTDKLDIRQIDPDEHPDIAREQGVIEYQQMLYDTYGSAEVVVFNGSAGRRLVLLPQIVAEAEHAFTSAILEVTGTQQKVVYFITGHGEADIYDTSPVGYSLAREGLKDNLFRTATLDLLATGAIPEDTALLVLAAPGSKPPITQDEIKLIVEYLLGGGRLLVLTNPDRPDTINTILAPFGVLVDKEMLIDPASYAAPHITSPSVPRTRNFWGLATTYFPGATAIIPSGASPKYGKVQTLVISSEEAYLDANYDPDSPPRFDEGVDTKGPQAIGVWIYHEPPAPENEDEEPTVPEDFRDIQLIVFADSDFASNAHFLNGGNSDLFLTSVQWLTAGKSIISIDRKFLQPRRFIVSPEAKNFINVSSIGLLPLALLVAGGIIWWRRR